MSVSVVIGAGFGDEGKGLVTDFLCSKNPNNTEVVRFSGGHQCAHRVVRGGKEHIFSNFGSGTLLGCPTYWSKYCTFEPVGFMRELHLLLSKGVVPTISVHPDCPVTTPYDIMANHNALERKHGTTGVGFFRTKKRHYKDNLKLTVQDMLSPISIEYCLYEIRKYYGLLIDAEVEKLFLQACQKITEDVYLFRRDDKEHLVFEGSQGLLLDEKIGTMPHCTPSDVTPRNALRMAGHIDEVWLVSRVYQTRHGNGPMTNEDRRVRFKGDPHESNETNEFQGRFRTSVLDLGLLKKAKKKGIDEVVPSGTKVNLVMTCADQVDKYELTESRNLWSFSSMEDFVQIVGGSLGINGDLYVNTSPCADTIRMVGTMSKD